MARRLKEFVRETAKFIRDSVGWRRLWEIVMSNDTDLVYTLSFGELRRSLFQPFCETLRSSGEFSGTIVTLCDKADDELNRFDVCQIPLGVRTDICEIVSRGRGWMSSWMSADLRM